MAVRIEPVRTLLDAMKMRAVRNECRRFMTRDTSRIGVMRQFDWYYDSYVPENIIGISGAWLVKTSGGSTIGWGYMKVDQGGRAWVTGGLKASFRGYGIGKRLFRHLTNTARAKGYEPWLEVYEWNGAGVGTYESLGYEEVSRAGNVITMRAAVYG